MGKKKSNDTSSDSDSDTAVTKTAKGFAKLKVGDLPTIRSITFINSELFNEKKLILDDEEESGGVTRVALSYKYEKGNQNFCLTCPKDQEAFLRTNGVEEETYTTKNGKRTATGKNIVKLYMDGDNEHHQKFYECLTRVCAVVKKKIEKQSKKKKIDIRIRGLYDIVDDAKNVTGHALAARLIESKAGAVYSAAYDDENQVDIKAMRRSVVRPALVFSYMIPEDGETYRITASIAQLYFKPENLFPLRDRD